MATFKDTQGREWELRLTMGMLPRLKAAGLDLAETVREGRLEVEWMRDVDLLGKVLWVLVERQAEKLGVSPEQLADAIDGPTLFALSLAYAEALADFSHAPEVAAELRRSIHIRAERTQRTAAESLRTLIGSTDGAGNSPASPASIPATSPSGS